MSLLDALLLDPVRIDTWVAKRADSVAGTGTQTDPYDGSTLAKFDKLMRDSVGPNTCVHLGPGEFETAGYFEGIGGVYWQPKTGMRIVGSGIDVTTLKLVSAATSQQAYAVAHPLSSSTVDFFELSDLTINCNWSAQVNASVASGAVRVMGNHSRVVRVKVS
jgi:hypothetical protein